MTWADYVSWTATTALPVAADPAYLRLGLIEESHEFLAAYASMQAAKFGLQKRVIRGDSEATLEVKQSVITITRQHAILELGDVAWYVARLDAFNGQMRPRQGLLSMPGPSFLHEFTSALHDLQITDDPMTMLALGFFLVTIGGQLIEATAEQILAANVAKLTARKSAGTIKGEGSR